MTVSNRAVTSREYKLMLNTDRFKDRVKDSETFFSLIDFLIKKGGGDVSKQDKEERRQTSYLDTPHLALRQNGFSLRLREEEANSFQLNLKCRAADRYVSAAQNVSSPLGGKIKFEEDILPPFASKFSHSNTLDFDVMPKLETIKDVAAMFPVVSGLGIDPNTPVQTANDFRALEIVRKLCKFKFGGPDVIKSSLSFWYLPDVEDWPLVGEFAFDYDATDDDPDKLEEFPIKVVQGAGAFFRALQNQSGWLDLSGTTKTAFALDSL